MVGIPHKRALWISQNLLPCEPALRQWLRRYGHIGLEIDDIVQEAYARIAALETVENVRNPKNYFFQTAHSIVVAHLRHSNVVSIRAISDIDSLGIAIDEFSPERRLGARDDLHKLAEAIDTLPKPCRDVLVLRRVAGFSQREVAARLGITESVVEHRMAKVIKFLMDSFGRGGKTVPQTSMRMKTSKLIRHAQQSHKPRD